MTDIKKNKKISQCPGTDLRECDEFIIARDGQNYKVSFKQITDAVQTTEVSVIEGTNTTVEESVVNDVKVFKINADCCSNIQRAVLKFCTEANTWLELEHTLNTEDFVWSAYSEKAPFYPELEILDSSTVRIRTVLPTSGKLILIGEEGTQDYPECNTYYDSGVQVIGLDNL